MPISPIDKVTQKNRKYWKLQEIVPENERLPVEVPFDMKEFSWWTFRSGFVDIAHYREFGELRSSKWFEIEVTDDRGVGVTEFDIRVGIVRKSGKEIVVSNVEVISPKRRSAIIQLIRHPELHKVMQSYKELEFFVVIDEKGEEREDINKFCK